MQKNRAALYHRVSTLDQDEGLATHELRQAAGYRGLEVVLEIQETGSGARNDRPGLQTCLRAVRKREIDVVLCWKLDRFGRSAMDLLANLEVLKGCGVRFIASSQGIDIKAGGDAMSNLMVTVLAAIAEFERDLIRERTRLGLVRAQSKGQRLGRPKSRIDLVRAEKLRDAGKTYREIAAALGVGTTTLYRAMRASE